MCFMTLSFSQTYSAYETGSELTLRKSEARQGQQNLQHYSSLETNT